MGHQDVPFIVFFRLSIDVLLFGDRAWICSQAGLELQIPLLLFLKCVCPHICQGHDGRLIPALRSVGQKWGLFLLCWVSEPSAESNNASGFPCCFSVLRTPGRF